MDAITLLTQKDVKKIEVREQLVSAIADGSFSLEDFKSRAGELNDKQTATFLEAVEAVTGKKLRLLSADYLHFAEQYILSDNNSCKREASRIVGNMAADYPEELENTVDSGTVVRWGSAYALARIIMLEHYRNSGLVQTVRDIYEAEEESGVKNQYNKALRKIKAI
ncbi:MAG: hypothetical protein IIY61_07925 [Ruminococcus sp.]|nr:hypothetical protein [Ruminococcus sp.]